MPMRTRSADRQQNIHPQPPNRLTLFFDGTGNEFKGSPGDTNIVKLYKMLDRNSPSQMHYYQPGIGTYPAEGPVNVSWFRAIGRKFETVIDSALATSFDSHVIAGYRFIMRYYKPGDRIYIFGFSRGAFTARFLSRMIAHVGLLSIGNEELVPFAYKVYQDYESGVVAKQDEPDEFMNNFKDHFCRTLPKDARKANPDFLGDESGIKVHFLGLFDCVSSVGNLDIPFFKKAPPLPAVRATADNVRHAVAIDERRVKFKAALFSQEQHETLAEDIKEVWFPGNHGDVGGGWDVDERKSKSEPKSIEDDHFQLSDIALKWMIDEIDDVESHHKDLTNESDNMESSREDHPDRLAWDAKEKASFLRRFQGHTGQMISARMHDTMAWDGGSSKLKALLWNLMEYVPWIIRRWEYIKSPSNSKSYDWAYIGWPPNQGGCRDIPSTALLHHSVIRRMRLLPDPDNYRPTLYVPKNQLFVQDSKTTAAPVAVGDLLERKLSELADQVRTKKDDDCECETTGLMEGRKPRIHFEHDVDLTKGSIAVEGQKVVGDEKWDRIYRVAVDHN